MTFYLLAVSAIIPSLLIMRYFHARDRYPEPQRVLWVTFGLGVLSVLGIFFVLTYSPAVDAIENPYLRGFADAFLVAAIPEELVKLLVLVRYCARKKEFNEPIDGLIYGCAASLGFATLENVLYVASNGFGVAVLRAFTAVPGHAFSGAILGWYVAKWKLERKKMAVVVGYLWIVLLHGLYDAPLLMLKEMQASGVPKGDPGYVVVGVLIAVVSIPVVVIEIAWARKLLLKARADQDGPATKARNELERKRAALTSSTSVDYLYLIGGGVLASVGGLILFGFILGAVFGEKLEFAHLMGFTMFGAPPLIAGWVLYGRGLKRRIERLEAQRALAQPARG